MTTAQTPPPGDQPKAEDIPLEDIDKLLESEDPDFVKELEEVKAVETDKNITLEATVLADDGDALPDKAEGDGEPKKPSLKTRIKERLKLWRANVRTRLVLFKHDSIVFLKTKPKEYALYTFAMSKVLAKKAIIPLVAFREATLPQKIAILVLVGMAATMTWVLKSNLKGVWIPSINEPILRTFEQQADFVETFDPKDGGESFYAAFPQERHEFLFRRMKTNLRAAPDSPNPMGAFEVIVELDSKDTAIEVRDREVEFFDYLQRVFEEQTFNELESELGKGRLKAAIKRELNQKLTQGWVKEVSFKTFVLKP